MTPTTVIQSPRHITCRKWQPLNTVWITLIVGYLFLIAMTSTRSPSAAAEATESVISVVSFRIDPLARRAIAALACTASTLSAYYTLGTVTYTSGRKQPPMLSAFLFYLLLTCIFAIDATDTVLQPLAIEIQNYYVHVVSISMMYSAFGTLIAMRHGPAIANAELALPRILAFYVWGLLLPAPIALLTTRSAQWAGPLAAVWAVVVLVGYSMTYKAASQRMQQLLSLHWSITANGFLSIVAWVITYLQHFGIQYGQGYTSINARAMYIFTLVFQSTQVGLVVLQAIDSFEESVRFKTERDAAQAELLVRAEQQRQAKESEDARQKFLRYIFHEIRVPFNSIDMGLSMLTEDLKAWHAIQTRTSSTSGSVSRLRLAPMAGPIDLPVKAADAVLPMGVAAPASSSSEGPHAPLPVDAFDILETMSKASASMKVIINDTLDWTKLQSGAFQIRPSPANVRKDVQNTLEGLLSFAQHSHVGIIQEIDDALPPHLLVDSVRLQQVVANFVSNGCKFARSDGTGKVTVRVLCFDDQCALQQDTLRRSSVTRLSGPSRRQQGEGEALQSPPPFNLDHVWWKAPEKTVASSSDIVMGGQQAVTSADTAQLSAAFLALDMEHRAAVPATAAASFPPPVVVPTSVPASTAHSTAPADLPAALKITVPSPESQQRLAASGYRLVRSTGAETLSGTSTEQGLDLKAVTVILSVRDNGDGIAEAEAGMLFDAFRQLDAGMQYKGKGTGLGLAICHEIITLHGGRVGVRSSGRPGEGAEFIAALRLPVLEHVSPGTDHAEGAAAFVSGPSARRAAVKAPSTTADYMRSDRHAQTVCSTGNPGDCTVRTEGLDEVTTRMSRTCSQAIDGGSGISQSLPLSTLDGGPVSRVDVGVVLSPPSKLPGQVETAHADTLSLHGSKRSGIPPSDQIDGLPTVLGPVPASMVVDNTCPRTTSGTVLEMPGAKSMRQLNILVVDDVTDNRKLLKRALQRRLGALFQQSGAVPPVHVQVDEASDGDVAEALIASRGAGWYDVITMDAEMPTMSGFIATEKIRQLGYKGLLYGCTGNALEADQTLFAEKGANAVYIKPIDVNALSEDIFTQLGTV